MPSLSSISSDPLILSFWAGAATRTARPVGNFLAPVVLTTTTIGRYKRRKKDSRLITGFYERAILGEAVQVDIDAEDASFNAQPFSIDYITDKALGTDLSISVKAGIQLVTNLAAEDHERKVIQAAVAAAGAGTAKVFTGNDPVKIIDNAILALMLSAKSQGVGVVFSPSAWDLFKNNPQVIARCKGDVSFASCPNLFHGGSQFETAYAFYDKNPLGVAEDVEFCMPANTVLIFARDEVDSLDNPSFLRTFRLDPAFFAAATGHAPVDAIETKDGRRMRVVCDWSEQVNICNAVGVVRFNVS
jgi:hypothetical protein